MLACLVLSKRCPDERASMEAWPGRVIRDDSRGRSHEKNEVVERCLSGRKGTPGKRVCVNNVPRVRIPLSPPIPSQNAKYA